MLIDPISSQAQRGPLSERCLQYLTAKLWQRPMILTGIQTPGVYWYPETVRDVFHSDITGRGQSPFGAIRITATEQFVSVNLVSALRLGARLSFVATPSLVIFLLRNGAVSNPQVLQDYRFWYLLRVPTSDYSALVPEAIRWNRPYLIDTEFSLGVVRTEDESISHFRRRVKLMLNEFFENIRVASQRVYSLSN